MLAVGGIYWADPDLMFRLYGAHTGGATERHLARTAFGGLHMAIGAGLILGAFANRWRIAGLGLLTDYLAGIVLGRMGSFVFDGAPRSPVILPELVAEILLLVCTIVLLRSHHFGLRE